MKSKITHDQIERQYAMAAAARLGLHDGMAVYAENAEGRRFGSVEVGTHPVHRIVVRLPGGRFEVIENDGTPWKPASREALGPEDFEACMIAAADA